MSVICCLSQYPYWFPVLHGCPFWAITLSSCQSCIQHCYKHFRFRLPPVTSYVIQCALDQSRLIDVSKYTQRRQCNAKFTEVSEGACDNPFDDGMFVLVRSFRPLESDQVNQISFGLCHVLREEGDQCIKQLQQGTHGNKIYQ